MIWKPIKQAIRQVNVQIRGEDVDDVIELTASSLAGFFILGPVLAALLVLLAAFPPALAIAALAFVVLVAIELWRWL